MALSRISRRSRLALPVSHRHGFTLIEALVSLGVIGLLLSLLMAAVQSSRERARQTQCLDNLRQLGVACSAFHATHQHFPPTDGSIHGDDRRFHSYSPHARMLPYLDQLALFRTLHLPEDKPLDRHERPRSDRNSEAMSQHVAVFVCPSDDVPPGGTSYRACMGIGPALHLRPGVPDWPKSNGSGPFRISRGMRDADIRDGLSNTVFFSEKLVGDSDTGQYVPWRDHLIVYNADMTSVADAERICRFASGDPPDHYSYGGFSWLFGGHAQTWYNHSFPPNSPRPDCGYNAGAFTARSYHVGGVNSVLGDGSARFISENMDLAVWRALATRDHGDAVSSEF
ncbi:MAG: DUF1559 domain-containing protein [Ardenticatenaceae bacterium]